MTTYSFKSMLKQTMVPTIVVTAVWITMSSVTTYYVRWLEREHLRIYQKNIVSIRAAETLQTLIWRLLAEWPEDNQMSPGFRIRWSETESRIQEELKKLTSASFTQPESAASSKIESSTSDFVQSIQQHMDSSTIGRDPKLPPNDPIAVRSKALETAGRITVATNELLSINQELVEKGTRQRRLISCVVTWSRLITMIIGPILGVFLGWRMSRYLHSSIARIAVTLHDASTQSEKDVGTIDIEQIGDFRDVQQQAEKIVERMRQVSRDLQNARREVMQAERLAAVGELAAGVAHEIRNPLTSVKLLLQHAIEQAAGPRLDKGQLELILDEIARMETTIQGLLDFSRPTTLNCVPHDIRLTLQRAINLVEPRAHQQGIDVVFNQGDEPLMVDGDADKLHQVFVNLLINATEAMVVGGRITIDAAFVRQASIDRKPSESINDADQKQMVRVVIQDTGRGIPDDVMLRLFEPFATSKERGTGLGLAVSHRIVEEHHGAIRARNRPQGGAEFTLTIPAMEQARELTSPICLTH